MTIDELVSSLEAATEGSRELDAYIWAAIHCPGQPVRVVEPATWKERRYFCNPDAAMDWIGYDLLNVAKHYTTSLDAALPGESIEMASIQRSQPGQPSKWAALDSGWPKNAKREVGIGYTEALARRIAALKARKEIQK
ncbi:MAG: hypothetical protein KGO96_10285 [Elusimicrobia bacterium]|nr:hypothetical protein [Elusimicrobiota bacterium]